MSEKTTKHKNDVESIVSDTKVVLSDFKKVKKEK